MSYSPWGKIQYSHNYGKGIRAVSTSSHGGFMLTEDAAHRFLSISARNLALKYQNYYCFEEDCDALIVMYEIPVTRGDAFFGDIVKGLSRWHPDFLIGHGTSPDPEPFREYIKDKIDAKMRKEKNPDLIVAAIGVSDDLVELITADDSKYIANREEYRLLRESGVLLRLSHLESARPAIELAKEF